MIKNYLLIAIRNLQRNSIYSFINIFGLSVGIACSMLILLWVHQETTYNKFLPNVDRLYQVWMNAEYAGQINTWNSAPLPAYPTLKTEDSRIKSIINTVFKKYTFDLIIQTFNSILQ